MLLGVKRGRPYRVELSARVRNDGATQCSGISVDAETWTNRPLSHVARVACRLTSATSSLDGSADPGRPRTLLSVLMRTLSLETTREVG